MFRRYSLVIIAALAVLLTSSAVAQSSFGTILGTIVDQTGAVVVNTTVEAKNTATGVVSTAQTQSDGDYTIVNLGRVNTILGLPR